MLDATLAAQLRVHLDKVVHPVVLAASLDGSPASTQLEELLVQVAALSDRITVERRDDDERRPSFAVERAGTDVSVRFAGIPLGHELTSFVLALLQVGGHPPKVDPAVADRIRSLPGEHLLETYFSLSCQNCPDVVQALNVISTLNPRLRHVAIDGALFRDEVEAREVMAVPTVLLDGEVLTSGRQTIEQLLALLDAALLGGERAAADAAALAGKEPFDVLIVGGGPAAASAAVYAARKGIRTGVVADRFGGQVLDTLGIENLISVAYTEGPTLATALEQHVRAHDVDVMTLQTARRLVPADEPGGLTEVELDSGVSLLARAVIVSTGARWRSLGVPGEAEHRNRGVAYCPHCDGPLFKGKRVAVIGGGNSGVEAAIDLAGIVAHVTLVEFDAQLRADDVLQRKLRSLPNVTILTAARTTEVLGDGRKVQGLVYEDRTTGATREIELEGVFVQIGLVPNTEWLEGSVALTPRGEVVIDDRGATSVPGVFAAGDCTTVPYKQIVVAMGAGATAALGAFDHLIRTSAPGGDRVTVAA